jgi:hypothetical protein
MAQIVDAGARRISVGGALTWTAINSTIAAARDILEKGDFSSLGQSPPLGEWFR